ncbi:unnamed protein product [Pleuronectes platessa]|uniref:Uncharacterized protein n=1 Tax=Pleuronectes platessa TaxID=8262 RepID=A0A9N7V523_PLEPL|nr:unnamed protein product [Pleuronectes platessa]
MLAQPAGHADLESVSEGSSLAAWAPNSPPLAMETQCSSVEASSVTSGARLDCTVSQSTFNLPSALSPPRKVNASARTALSPPQHQQWGSALAIHNRWQLPLVYVFTLPGAAVLPSAHVIAKIGQKVLQQRKHSSGDSASSQLPPSFPDHPHRADMSLRRM